MRDREPASGDAAARDARLTRRGALTSLAAVGTLAVAGCSSAADLRLGVNPVWERSFPTASGAAVPAATNWGVVVGAQDKHLYAFDPDGERLFDVETGGPIEARPVVPATGGPVHVHSTDGDDYTVSRSREVLWSAEGQSRRGWLGRHGDLCASADPVSTQLVGYDARTGERRFTRPTDRYPSPVLADGACLYHAPTNGDRTRLTALETASGEQLWATPPRDTWTPVVAAGDRVLTRRRGMVRSRAVADGRVRWRADVPGESPLTAMQPLWVGEGVYLGVRRRDQPDRLLVLDRADGTRRWRRTVGTELEGVAPTADGVVVASSVNDPDGGILIRLDSFTHDGTRRWQTTTDLQIGGTIQTVGRVGAAVVAASDTAVAAFDPDDGSQRWHFNSESYRLGVAVGDERLYVSYRSTGGVARLPVD